MCKKGFWVKPAFLLPVLLAVALLAGCSNPSGSTPPPPPLPPSMPVVTAIATGDESISVTWGLVAGATSYEVYYSENSTLPTPAPAGNTAGVNISETTAAITITGLDNGTPYYVWVRAKNDAGPSDYIAVYSGNALTPSTTVLAPAAPTITGVTPGNQTLTVTWDVVVNAATYEVYYHTSNIPASATKFGEDTTGTSATITGLDNDKSYYVWVRAKNTAGTTGTYSTSIPGTPSATLQPPAKPAGIIVESSNGTLTVTWGLVAGATSYEVYYSESGTLPTPAPAGSTAGVNISGTTATITGLTSGKLYYVWVRAINDAGIGEYSTRDSGTPEYSLSMGANTATVTGIAASLEVVWTAVDGATGYDVYYNTANTAPTETTNGSGNVTITGTVATITGLGNGTTYYVWVRAKNASTTGAWAAQSSGTPEAVVIPADLGQYFQSLPYQGLAALAYYDDGFVVDVNAKTFYNYSDSTFNMKWGGTIIKIVPEGDASIMIVKIETVTGNWPTPPEVGKYFAAAYKNLLPWGNGIFAVNSNAAYKEIGGNNAGTATITEAVSEYTVANGYYNSLSTTMYYSHTTSATTLAPLQGNWEWDSYEDYLIQIRGTKLTEWFDDDSDGTYDSYTEKDSLGELGDIVDSTNTSQTSGILYVKIIDSTVFSADKYIAVAWKNLTDSSVSFLTTGGAGNAGYATLTEVKTALNDLSNDSQFPAASFLDFDLK